MHEGIPEIVRELAAVDPKAFTLGTDVYFAPGHYDLTTHEGFALLGHELIHTQQAEEEGLLAFALNYVAEYQKNIDAGMTPWEAYRTNPYENEAYNKQKVLLDELKRRFPDDPTCGCGDQGGVNGE